MPARASRSRRRVRSVWQSGRNEPVPRFHGGGREKIRGRGRGGAAVYPCLTGHDLAAQRRHFSADDSGRSRGGIGDEPRLVITKDELAHEREGLCMVSACRRKGRRLADRDGVCVPEEVPGVCGEHVAPAALLVDDACEVAGVVVPRSFWLASETLDAAKRRVLWKAIYEY